MFNNFQSAYFAGSRPRIMAHRGSSGSCPENTMVSFNQAIADGADILEMDVQLTRDAKVVVIHDPTVDRTTGGAGYVSRLSYDQLKKLDAGYRFSKDGGLTFPYRGQGIGIPLFEEVLQAFPVTPINVEIKDENPVLAAKMAGLLHAYGRIEAGSVLVAADEPLIMERFRRQACSAITGHSRTEVYRFLASAWLGIPSLFSPAHSGMAIQLPLSKLGVTVPGKSVLDRAHKLGLEVHVWTVNDPVKINELVALGVDGIFTDNPSVMSNVLKST